MELGRTYIIKYFLSQLMSQGLKISNYERVQSLLKISINFLIIKSQEIGLENPLPRYLMAL